MKNQTDIIVSVVAVLLALILGGVFMGTARPVTRPAPPEKVIVTAPQYPAGSVSFSNSLAGGGPGGGGAGLAGARPGVGAPGGGRPAAAPSGSGGGGAEMMGVAAASSG